jgi:hypothetical protein
VLARFAIDIWGNQIITSRSSNFQAAVLDSNCTLEISEKVEDRDWDSFLEGTPLGQFQQSSLWARAKFKEGWNVARFILRNDRGEIEGGFQLLWRKRCCLKIGYISKGPVFQRDSGKIVEFSRRLVTMAANRYGTHALIVQAPDCAAQVASLFFGVPFEENIFISVISANLIIDLTQGIAEVRNGMSRKTRQKSRQALARGVSVREGDHTDLATFFELMLATCKRQGEKRANPETLEELKHIWHVYRENNHIRLLLAVCEGEIVAGLMSIMFGERVTLWKKGWSGRFPERHPNELLHTESIEWAAAHGYRSCDFLGLDRGIAETLVRGGELSEVQKKSRHFFNLSLGGKPVLLPKSRAYLKNAFHSSVYRGLVRCRSAYMHYSELSP